MALCPICQTEDVREVRSAGFDGVRFDCVRCGEFDLSGTAMAMLPALLSTGVHRRALMSQAVRRMGRDGRPPLITSDALESFWGAERLSDPKSQADQLILFFGDGQLSPDTEFRASAFYLGAWIGTALLVSKRPHTGLQWLLKHLFDEKIIDGIAASDGGRANDLVYTLKLTMRGWERYAVLKQQRAESRTAFIAMKFDDKVLDSVVERCFKPAVARTGFELRKLTDNQPAGLIDDQIRASILSGRFVIADLTHGSHGAYWEAGFAEGLRLPVIYTCEQSSWEEKRTHFDTNHMLTIIWNADKLKKAEDALTATIRATLRNDARQAD